MSVANYLCTFCDYVTLDVIFSDKIINLLIEYKWGVTTRSLFLLWPQPSVKLDPLYFDL